MDDLLDSKIGGLLVSVYAVASIASAVASYVCTKDVCNGLIVVPILPWAALLVSKLNLSIPWATYPLFLLLNATLLYVLGLGVELLLQRFFGTPEETLN